MVALPSGCGTLIQDPVEIKNETLYAIKGDPRDSTTFPTYAVQFDFLDSKTQDLNKAAFDALFSNSSTAPRVSMSIQAWSDFNTSIGQLCTQVPCDYDLLKNLSNSFIAVERVSGAQFAYDFSSGFPVKRIQ